MTRTRARAVPATRSQRRKETTMPSLIEDRDEILQLLYRYNHAIDGGEPERWADTFVEDGALEAGGQVMAGRDELVAFASTVHGLRHVVTNPVVAVTGDTAS